ncbi:beta-D-glucosyl crocetin beta-1,6-glucosyltransferase-like [Sesamum indicum]|uniref:Glycosyltransferase n=1 Tax=Sesamum indicum TaxID=4182 RepID=A0A6F8PDZ5_SESIN|nr:beta-D-glucosyl crocetin beta-1,6-glucosyltransferase-like [Sesamum indicum]BBK26435.1 UDP-glycosyltransferase [Sesamum indicum]
MGTENSCWKVMMLPWLAYGHISPFLELAKRLSNRNIQTYLCSTPANLSSIKNKIPGKYSSSIHLLELHLPDFLPQLPPHNHTTNGLPPNLISILRKALDSSKLDFSTIMKSLQPDLLIHDTLIEWAAGVAFSNNIPSVSFLTSGAAMFSFYYHSLMKPDVVEYPFPAIKFTGPEHDMINGNIESFRKRSQERDLDNQEATELLLIKSSKEIEGKYIDYLSQLTERKIVPVGPLVSADRGPDDENSDLMEWLGKKSEFSTVFVSFGSEYFLKTEEIEEIAYALELSDVNFVWVVRFPGDEEKRVQDALPGGFLERTQEKGKIMEKWAPQAKILGHPSVGGFVSHCGWNSVIESIHFGVPIIAMPMQFDQPINAKLVVELGVGVEVDRDERGRFRREDISKVIKDVVGIIGEELRRKVGEKRETLRANGEEEIDELVQEIAQLCGKSSVKGSSFIK